MAYISLCFAIARGSLARVWGARPGFISLKNVKFASLSLSIYIYMCIILYHMQVNWLRHISSLKTTQNKTIETARHAPPCVHTADSSGSIPLVGSLLAKQRQQEVVYSIFRL